MKLNTHILAGLGALLVPLVPLVLNAQEPADEHAGHDHAAEGAKDEHANHDNPPPGPNGGKVFSNVEPHAEFFVTKDRKVQITFLDHDNKVVPPTDQSVKIICGSRSNPTTLAFEKKDNALVSTTALPAGNLIPTVMQIKTGPAAQSVMTRFNLNLNPCPTCQSLEYCCTCPHGGDEDKNDPHAGHNH